MVVFIPGPISTPPKLRFMLPSEFNIRITPDVASVDELEVFQKQDIPFAIMVPLSVTILWPSSQLIDSFNFNIQDFKFPVLLRFNLFCVGEELPSVMAFFILNSKGSISKDNANLSNVLSILKVEPVCPKPRNEVT